MSITTQSSEGTLNYFGGFAMHVTRSTNGLGVLAYVLGRFLLQGTSVLGFPFLASVIAIFSGAQLSALGIIGEYLARMHFRMMDKPPYVKRGMVNER